MKKLILVLLLGTLIFWGCKKEDPIYPFEQENITEEGLTFEEDSVIASLPSRVFKSSEILLDNGETVEAFLTRTNPGALNNWGHRPISPHIILGEEAKNDFIQKLLSEGSKLSSDFPTPYDVEDDITIIPFIEPFKRPKQTAYAYVYNTDNSLNKRKRAGDCNYLLYGMDCSAMVTWMLTNAGVNFGRSDYSADELSHEEILNYLLSTSPLLKDFGYEYEDKETIPESQIHNGDIIYFKKSATAGAFHIGIALNAKDGSGLWIYQSNGKESVADKKNPGKGGCEVFSKEFNRGPHAVPIFYQKTNPVSIFQWGKDYSNNYGVLQLVPKKQIDPDLTGTGTINSNGGTTGTIWKISSEISKVKDIVLPGVDGDKLKLTFDDKNNFTLIDEDPNDPSTCTGTFTLYGPNKKRFRFSSDCFVENPLYGKIISLTPTKLVMDITLKKNNQINTITWVKM